MSAEDGVELNRRKFLKQGMSTAAGTFIVSAGMLPKAVAQVCGGLTPVQTSGPFYPGEANFHKDNDLTLIAGHNKAKGMVVYVKGKILDATCRPVSNAGIEIWQACASGKYNNSKDDNPAPLDPNFKYWGETYSDQNGNYIFKTIIPGSYPADTNWTRPPHIHFKVSKLGYQELVTQMYFKGNALNDKDLILQALPKLDQAKVIVGFSPSPNGFEPGSGMGEFDITLKSVR